MNIRKENMTYSFEFNDFSRGTQRIGNVINNLIFI